MKTKRNRLFKVLIALALPLTMLTIPMQNISAEDNSLERQLIPQPLKYETTGGSFKLQSTTEIYVQGNDAGETAELLRTGNYVAEKLRSSTGYTLPVKEGTGGSGHISITTVGDNAALEEEGYQIKATPATVKITANKPAGAFMGVQTLRQLLPADIEKDEVVSDVEWLIPCSDIEDKPEYDYRGTMLDVSRHFSTVEQVKRQIDNVSQYKLNKFHMHLTDDQGWRIEIKGGRYGEEYSKLTGVGASSSVHGCPGGYYTQEEFQEIVAYAQERYIEVIPEIDMPGHSWAALISLEFLNSTNDGKPQASGYDNTKPYTGINVGFSTFECRNEKTYEFIEDVIAQLAAISPSPYIHVGGDEAHVTSKEDYKYFMDRVTEIAKKYGKTPIGWQDYDSVVSDPDAVGQYWSNNGSALLSGRNYVVSPANKAYIDMKYNGGSEFGLSWAGLVSVQTAYNWDPTDYGTKDQILGIEAPLWAETVDSNRAMDYLTFPRIAGLAEIGWTPKENRSWEEYQPRIAAHGERLTNQGIEFYKDTTLWPEPPLFAQWDMDENDGTTILDRTNTHEGKLEGGVSWTDGKYNSGLLFDGTSGYVDLGFGDLVGDWTIGLWINRETSLGDNAVLLSGNEGEIKLDQWKNTGKVGITKFGVNDYTYDYQAPINEWVHLTFVGSSEGTTLYVNGERQDHINSTISAPAAGMGASAKRDNASRGYMNGKLDELKIFNRALSAEEVSRLPEKVDRSSLIKAIKDAEALEVNDYTTSSYKVVTTALDAAIKVRDDEDASQDDVDNVTTVLEKAIKSLKKRAETTTGEALLNSYKGLKEVNYTEKSWNVFASAKAALEEALKDVSDISVDDMDYLCTALEDAHTGLVKSQNKEALNDIIVSAEGLDKDAYTTSSYKKLVDVVVDAREVLEDADVLQEDINEAVKAVEKAISGLVERATTEKAEELLSTYDDLKKSEYTEKSWNTFASAKDALIQALNDVSDMTQKELDALCDTLEAAYKQLKVDEGKVLGDQQEIEKGTQTGDTTNTAALVGLLAVAGVAILIVYKKKKSNKESE